MSIAAHVTGLACLDALLVWLRAQLVPLCSTLLCSSVYLHEMPANKPRVPIMVVLQIHQMPN